MGFQTLVPSRRNFLLHTRTSNLESPETELIPHYLLLTAGATGPRRVRSHSGWSHPCPLNHTGPYSQSQSPSSCWGPPQHRRSLM